jgi:hypothetical protein
MNLDDCSTEKERREHFGHAPAVGKHLEYCLYSSVFFVFLAVNPLRILEDGPVDRISFGNWTLTYYPLSG